MVANSLPTYTTVCNVFYPICILDSEFATQSKNRLL